MLIYSARPLSLQELAEAAAIDPGAFDCLDENLLFDVEDLLTICGSLITLHEGQTRLSHYSVQEFLVSNRIQRSQSHRVLYRRDSS